MDVSEVERLRAENARLRQALGRATVEGGAVGDRMDRGIGVVLDHVSMAFFGLDAEGRFDGFRTGRLRLAMPPEVFLGRTFHEVFPEPFASLFETAMDRVRATGRPDAVEYEMENGDAPRGLRRYAAHFAPEADGGTSVLVEDITERHRAETTLRESERRFRALIENATDILYVLDAEQVVRFWSPGATAALGWTSDEAVGRFGPEFVHPDDAVAMVPPDPDPSPGAKSERFTYRVRHRDGTWRELDAMVRNLLGDPAVGGVIVNARDVTEQRRLEARSVESQKLESIGRLAGGIAHDFNNLLTVILSCGELVQDALATGTAVEPNDVVEIIEAGGRARDLTRQLLAFARRQIVEPTTLELDALVLDSQRLLRRVLGEDISVEIHLGANEGHVRGDPAQLQQVILNLAVNARDAMPNGGRLEIVTARVAVGPTLASTVTGLQPGPHLCISVRDEGPGLSPEIRAHLFEPFFTTKPPGQGTGLGLATAYGIVRQAGGGIAVESAPGQGARFDVYLPQVSPAAAPAAPTPVPRARRGDATVLLVEDDPAVGQITARILREGGYEVLHARHGGEALVLARQTPGLALLLTDVVMPGMDGRQVADAVLGVHPDIGVLFISGYTRDALVRRGVADGGAQFLAKPFSPAALLARVDQVIGASRPALTTR